VMPYLGGVARNAVLNNRDPKELGDFDSVKIQKEILEATCSKFLLVSNCMNCWTIFQPFQT